MLIESSDNSPPLNHAICDLTPEIKSIDYSRDDHDEESSEDKVWGPSDKRNIFDIIDEFDDETDC